MNHLTTSEIVTIIIIVSLIAIFLCTGCNFRNAELIRWNSEGQKAEQVRTGQINVLYWFGLDEAGIYADPNNFEVYVSKLQEKPDPNTVNALVGIGKLATRIP